MDSSSKFALNFSIPQGPTGPAGPQLPICNIDYKISTNNKNLSINSSQIYHSNGEFSVNGDTVIVNPGLYEITFCGLIEAASSFQNSIMLALYDNSGNTNQTINGMIITLPDGTLSTHFSETRIFDFSNTKNIVALITNPNSTAVRISTVSLLIKKIGSN